MISDICSLIAVGFLWGATNPFIRLGSEGIDKVHCDNKLRKFLYELWFLATRWKYIVPFLLNQSGSILYLFTLQNVSLSLAVPVSNALSFVFTALVGYLLGETAGSANNIVEFTKIMNAAVKKKKWSDQEENILLDIWSKKIMELRKVKRNSHIYMAMAKEFEDEYNISIKPKEIQRKLNNLTQKYRTEKRTVATSGSGQSEWRLYHRVHELIGHFAANDLNKSHEAISCDFASVDDNLSIIDTFEEGNNDSSVDYTKKSLEPQTKSSRKRKSDICKKRANKMTTYLKKAFQFIEKQDEFTTFGEHVANQMRNLNDKKLQCIAQHKIQSILFELSMKKYSSDS